MRALDIFAAGLFLVGWLAPAAGGAGPAVPDLPALDRWPPELRVRLQQADRRARTDADLTALGELGRLYLANGLELEAKAVLEVLERDDPQNPHWPHFLAVHESGYGQLEAAAAHWQRVLALAPGYTAAQLLLGSAWIKLNQLENAQQVFAAALATAPGDPEARLGLAEIDFRRGEFATARLKLDALAGETTAIYAVNTLLAAVADQQGDAATAARARAACQAAGRFRAPPDPWSDALLSDCYDVYRLQVAASARVETGRAAEAVALLERAARLAPDDARTHRQLGRALSVQRDWNRAAAELERAVALQPAEPATYLNLCDVAVAQGRRDSAQAILRRGVARCPQAAGLHYELGLALLGEGRLEEAVPLLRRTLELSPETASAGSQLVLALFRLGRTDEAQQALAATLQRHPGFAPALLLQALSAVRAGDEAGATSWLARAQQSGAAPEGLVECARRFRERFGHELLLPPNGGPSL